MKTCSKCGAEKPLEKFIKDHRYKFGRGSWCVPCKSLYDKIGRATKWKCKRVA